jgi:hypothetical protein
VDFTCQSDFQCPDGMSCAPATIGADTTSFHMCRTLGTGTQRCDDDVDCIETRHCAASGNCTADFEANTGDCTRHSQCVEGTYCDSVGTGKCAAVILPNQPCNTALLDSASATADHAQCGPNAAGCFLIPARDVDGVPTGVFDPTCKVSLVANGGECYPYELLQRAPVSHGSDCAAGACEAVDATDNFPYRCTPGVAEGEACDDDVSTTAALSCATGLICRDGECVAQIGPGAECDDGGAADAAICANGSCYEQWDEFMCSDAPVPTSAGGTNVTCDGE